MSSKDKLFRLLYLALIEIRAEASDKDKKVFEISNLVHNLPLKLNKENLNYDLILNEIFENAQYNKGLKEWLEANID